MKLRLFLAAGLCASLCPILTRAAPADDLKKALQDFLDQPNYTWGTSNSRGMPEDNNGNSNEPDEGQHEKGGFTKAWFPRGPHIPRDAWPAVPPRLGFTDDEGFWSQRWLFETPDGWKLLSQLPVPGLARPATGIRGPSRTSTGGISLGSASVGGLLVVRWFGFLRPDHEIAIIIQHLDQAEELSIGKYRLELPPAGAVALVNPRKPWSSSRMPYAVDPKVVAEFTVRDGVLVNYEFSVEAVSIVHTPISYKKTRTLLHLGTTQIDVPDEVRRRFER
jgi:hypothetical protein